MIETYTRNQKHSKKNILISPASCSSVGTTSQDETIKNWLDCTEERASSETDDDDDDVDISLPNKSLKRKELSVEYLEDECDLLLDADDLDGSFYLFFAYLMHDMTGIRSCIFTLSVKHTFPGKLDKNHYILAYFFL